MRVSGHFAGDGIGEAFGCREFAAAGSEVPTKSVSQNLHTALLRSSSRPLHRLQPAKRRNTARGRHAPPSPCSV
jgi:hypothetical protein